MGIIVFNRVFGEGEVVGGDFCGDVDALFFGLAEGFDGVGRGDVLHVDVGTGVGGKNDVAGDDDVFCGVGPALESEFCG